MTDLFPDECYRVVVHIRAVKMFYLEAHCEVLTVWVPTCPIKGNKLLIWLNKSHIQRKSFFIDVRFLIVVHPEAGSLAMYESIGAPISALNQLPAQAFCTFEFWNSSLLIV